MSTVLHYTVRAGDSFSAIAGGVDAASGVTYQAIEAANPGTPANALQVGQVILIPAADGSGTALHYTVRPGDSYAALADALEACAGLTVSALEAANPTVTPTDLQIGNVLAVPATGETSQPDTNESPLLQADNIGYWDWTWDPTPATPGATFGLAFSGWTDVTNAVQQSDKIKDELTGDKYICFGGGNQNGAMTSAGLQAITEAIKEGTLAGYDGVAYDVEVGDAGLEQDFTDSFAAAQAAGFKVLVTMSHSAPYGISDGAALMQSFFSDENIDFLSPQLYTTGSEAANDYATSHGVTWNQYAAAKAAIIPSIVKASYYADAQSYFAEHGVELGGFAQWSRTS